MGRITETELTKIFVFGFVVAVVVLSGCMGGPKSDTNESSTNASNPSDMSNTDGQMTAEWCARGQAASYSSFQSGQLEVTVKGMVEKEGRSLCKVEYTGSFQSRSNVEKMVLYFSEGGNYTKIEYYDGNGNLVSEFENAGGGTPDSGLDRSGSNSTVTSGSSETWCTKSQASSYSRSGGELTATVKGQTKIDGKTVCEIEYKGNLGSRMQNTDIQRMVIYFTKNGDYVKYEYYDGNGNLVKEFSSNGGTPSTGSGFGG